MSALDVALFIDPASYHFECDRLFELSTALHGGDDVLAPYVYLRRWMAERGVPVHTADLLERGAMVAERNIYVSLGIRHRYQRLAARGDVSLSAFFAMECPVVEPKLYRALDEASVAFTRLFSYSTGAALRPFLRAPLAFDRFRIPQSFDAVHNALWSRNSRRVLTIINANKRPRLFKDELYTERLRAIEFFARRGEIDLYGLGWEGPPYRLGETWIPATGRRAQRKVLKAWQRLRPDPLLEAARSAHRGAAASKSQTLSQYQFAICFENMVLEGWLTEKLFDCLFAGTVPVYLGAPDVDRWVPPECFIDMRRFTDYASLREFILSLSAAEVQSYRDAGREFVVSERFRPHTKQAFAELFGRIVEEDTGVCLFGRAATPLAS